MVVINPNHIKEYLLDKNLANRTLYELHAEALSEDLLKYIEALGIVPNERFESMRRPINGIQGVPGK